MKLQLTEEDSELINNLDSQQDYLKVLLDRTAALQQIKRDDKVSDLEIGFEIGFIYRMLQEYSSNSYDLKEELKALIYKKYE